MGKCLNSVSYIFTVATASNGVFGEGSYNGAGLEIGVRARIQGAHGICDKAREIYGLLVEDINKQLPYITSAVHVIITQVYVH